MNIYFPKQLVPEDYAYFGQQVGEVGFDASKVSIRSEEDLVLLEKYNLVGSVRELTLGRMVGSSPPPLPLQKVVEVFQKVPLTHIHLKTNATPFCD